MYIGIAACLRELARRITVPIKKPAKIDVEVFAKDCKRIWAMLDDIFGQYEVFALKLEAMEELFAPVFSPLNVSQGSLSRAAHCADSPNCLSFLAT